MGRRVLIVTYTLANPAVVGVFFRALRLGFELERRGHEVVIANAGPVPVYFSSTASPDCARARAPPWRVRYGNDVVMSWSMAALRWPLTAVC